MNRESFVTMIGKNEANFVLGKVVESENGISRRDVMCGRQLNLRSRFNRVIELTRHGLITERMVDLPNGMQTVYLCPTELGCRVYDCLEGIADLSELALEAE